MRMIFIHYFISSFFLVLFWSDNVLCNQIVNTDRGTVLGTTINLFGVNVHLFRGIPFAKPPIGDRRFKPPQPLQSNWTGVLNASQYSPSCPQKTPIVRLNPQGPSSQINEDCLYLNVFTPQLGVNTNLSVMVWIHGGRFLSGSGAWWQGQTIAAMETIIVVTINYRLGIFGFLSTGESSSPRLFTTNNGLLDQQLALKWVRNNIRQFGGNPDRVTIAGNSAGGMAVAFHTVIPSSYPYYRAAIMQSGQLLLNVGVYTLPQARGIFQEFAQESNCSRNSISLSVACIEKLSTDQVIAVQKTLVKTYFTLARPIIDGTLITDSPTALLNNGLFNKNMKVLMGFTKDDGTYIFDTFAELPYGLDRVTFKVIIKQFYASFGQNAVDAIIYKYTDWHNVTSLIANRDQLGIAATDVFFVTPTIQSANEYVGQGIPTYIYVFDRQPFESAYDPQYYGVTHAAEIPYVFGYPINKPSYYLETFVGVDQTVSRNVMQMWANFVKTGSPNLQSASNPWPKYDLKKKGYLSISQYLTVGYNYRPGAVEFWGKYLPSLAANSAPCPTNMPSDKTIPTDASTNLPITASTSSSTSTTTVSVSSSSLTVTRKLLIVTIILSVLSAIFMIATVVLAALLFRRSTSSKTIAKF